MIAIQQTKYIAGEMLIVSVPYLEKKIHPTVIIRGMQRALEDIVAHYQSEFFVMFVSVIYNIKFHLYLYSVRRNFVHSWCQRSRRNVARDRLCARHEIRVSYFFVVVGC